MQLDRFNQFVDHAVANGVVFYHSGNLDQETVAAIGALLRRRLQEEGANGTQARKVFTTFMEMAQNILHYAAPDGSEDSSQPGRFGAFSVARSGDGYAVMCGNYLDPAQVPRVRARIESVQEMEPDQVRKAYRRQLASEADDSHSKGAGLGLLTMAASSRAPMEFVFVPDPPDLDRQAFLFLKALI